MEKTFVIPSALEENYREFEKVADDLFEGLKITNFKDKDYILGKLALKEGLAPHKFLNSSAEDIDYQLIGLTALAIAGQGSFNNFIVTTGFPFTTYQSYRAGASDFFKGHHSLNIDTRPLGGTSVDTINFNVQEINVMTEIEGAVKFIRDGELKDNNNFLIAGIGYGTFELALSRTSGLLYRTTVSSTGIIYAMRLLEEELQKHYYYNILTDQQLEIAFQRGSIIVNRRPIDLIETRNKVLETYYNEVISPIIRRSIKDEDFYGIERFYIVGGGALYPKLIELFKQEFQDVIEIVLVPSPNFASSRGYCFKSIETAKEKIRFLDNKKSYLCVGLDLGNNNTVITINDEF